MIPKNIYFYWGNESMSFLRYMTLYSFRYHNPDWNITLIRNNKSTKENMKWDTLEIQDKMNYEGMNYSDRVKDLNVNIIDLDYSHYVQNIDPNMSDVHISDFTGWYMLWKKGGIISDMDVFYTKPLNIDLTADICLSIFPNYEDYVPVTFMASSGNRFFEDCFNSAKENYEPTEYQSAGTKNIKYHTELDIAK